VYNYTSRETINSPGVQIRVPGFGNTTTVEYLDPSEASPGLYFKSIGEARYLVPTVCLKFKFNGFFFKLIVEQSLIPLGYSRNADVRGV